MLLKAFNRLSKIIYCIYASRDRRYASKSQKSPLIVTTVDFAVSHCIKTTYEHTENDGGNKKNVK